MDFEAPPTSGKKNLVLALVVVGIVVLGVGAFVAFKKTTEAGGSGSGAAGDDKEVAAWCKIRREWAREVRPLNGDLLLKIVQDPEAAKKLNIERNKLCQQYAKRVRDLKPADPRILEVEKALIAEGKVRANVAVEISNVLVKLSKEDIESLRRAQAALEKGAKARLSRGRANADLEVKKSLAHVGSCKGIYRGPMTDAATSENPYTTWDELELRRTEALKKVKKMIEELQPKVDFTNRVYHALIARYRAKLKSCYRKQKRKNPKISQKMGLRVRLKRDGKVKSLAIEWMEVPSEPLLDCILNGAARWRLPRPVKGGDYVVVPLDFSTM